MTIQHIALLHFAGSAAAAKKRLQRLKSSGLIAERPRRPFDKAVLSLARRGLVELRDRGVLAEYPPINMRALERRAGVSELTLRHELEVVDVRAAFVAAVRDMRGLHLTTLSTWPLLHEFTGPRGTIKPDGFLSISQTRASDSAMEHAFFLEIDRSTEPQATLVHRAKGYADHYKSGDFAVRNGASRADYKKHPFRALYVLKTEERRNNTAEALLQIDPPILSHVWLTTLPEVLGNPLGDIWICPSDYGAAIAGTQFQTQRNYARGYKRQTARDTIVSARIKKRHLVQHHEGVKSDSSGIF
jgi:hypothetical protein